MQWLFGCPKKKLHYPSLHEVLILEQLNIIEDKLDFIIQGNEHLSDALEALKAEVVLVVDDIAKLAGKIADQIVGTADSELIALTAQLKVATDAVSAILQPVVADTPPAS